MTTRRNPLRSALRSTSLVLASLGLLTLAACGRPDPVNNTPVVNVTPATPATTSMPGTAPTQSAQTTGSAQSDLEITSQVKSSLMGDDLLGRQNIDVQTTAGEVRLSGVLDNQAQKDQAMVIARAVIGVRGIQDELTLKP